MALEYDRHATNEEADASDPWDFPTLTPENFSELPPSSIGYPRGRLTFHLNPDGSPERRKIPQDPLAVHLSLAEAFKNYDQVLFFLEKDRRLEIMLRELALLKLLSERQIHEFSSPDPDKLNPGRFLLFLTAVDASALLAGVVTLMGADPAGRLLLCLVNSPKSPYTDFYEITRGQLLGRPPPTPKFSPAPTQPMALLHSPPGTPTPVNHSAMCFPEEPSSPSSLKGEMYDIPELPIRNIPDDASDEQQFPFSVIRDIELSGARVILTRTHTLYRDSSSRCFIAFNVVFQPNQNRFRAAEISMAFLPIPGSKQQPVILNIFPNPNQRLPTGPSCDLISNAKKNINLTVGTASPANVNANLGLENSTEIRSASNSSLTTAGIATSKLTISLSESRAGDGIIYSFAFAVVLDLKTQSKPDFSANLRLNWHLGNRTWLPRHRYSFSDEVSFSKLTELDSGDLPSISSRQMAG
ncbi:hypothetical protein PSTT_06801 [Puccinia striiformis]|uniref:Uncharacterized protein n=1 Tax=Puccinia striiformis TaxID=27350 RepID=A0A2S4VJ75_9BASI|nr:hypothetical protein PSTT_06801 [Puccinia striiformis]